MRKLALAGLVILTVVAMLCMERTEHDTALGSGLPAGLPPTPQVVRGAVPHAAEAGTHLSTGQVVQGGMTAHGDQADREHGAHSEARDAGASPALATTFADFADEMQPTVDGLWASTVDLWSNEDFLALSIDEANELLPTDERMGFQGPDSFVAIVGGLPTREDVEAAARDPQVICALQSACGAEMVYRTLQMVAKERRSAEYPHSVEMAQRAYARSWELLMATLDARTQFHGWSLLWKAWERWIE